MSVDYKSALIYGFDCDPTKWTCEEREAMADFGWDVIQDGYDDKFLYIGKLLSQTSCYDKAKIDCLRELSISETAVNELIEETPEEFIKRLPCDASMYHLCYAT